MLHLQKNNNRRIGVLETRNGVIQTPFFMPDATRASVRGIANEQLDQIGIEAMVVNTYHIYLRPGVDVTCQAGGVHKFMKWEKPLLSDSGGYQVYSLIHQKPDMGRITEKGAEFRSVLDGSKHLLTPEKAIQIQFDLGVDMMVCLDDPRPNNASYEDIEAAVDRTIRWATRCKSEYEKQVQKRTLSEKEKPLLFGVVQGGEHRELRKRCADGLIEIGFDGYGFGARHISADGNFLDDIMRYTASILPKKKPRFALGVGTPQDIVKCYEYGWDMFDCVIPTREGRHGRLFLWNKNNILSESKQLKVNSGEKFYTTMNITNGKYKDDFLPIDESCDCYACKNHARAYIHHLFRSQEALGPQLATIHNLYFYMRLMEKLRGK